MNKSEIKELVQLRSDLIESYNSLRDYRNNPNAIMKEVDHARLISGTIKKIDAILKEHVEFK